MLVVLSRRIFHTKYIRQDAITIKQSSGTSTIQGGGAKNASDKVIQHNGGGNVVIKDYCVQNFGKLYRSCGNCSSQKKRTVSISNVIASDGKLLAGVNSNVSLPCLLVSSRYL